MKKYILGLLLGFVCFMGFCSSDLYTVESDILNCTLGSVSWSLNSTLLTIQDRGDGGNYNLCFTCENNVSGRCGNINLQAGASHVYSSSSLSVGCNGGNISSVSVICKTGGDDFSLLYTGSSCPCGGGSSSCPECEECESCPEVNTGEILSGYILESDIDINYCVSNDLCPVSTGSWSELVINDVVHESAPLINITIPQEYSWDYNITENEFTLDISGYNVDYDYIDGIITTQNSKPTTEDFNNIVSGLIPLFVPGLVIILFLWFCFKFIKKIF